jgi:hypothetical protein
MGEANATILQPSGWSPSGDLRALLDKLSRAQACAITRIAESELTGATRESMFYGPNRVCNRSTFYRPRGWLHKPEFRAALELAEHEVRAARLEHVIDDALAELKEATPLAARDLRRQIVGDEEAIDALAAIARDTKRKQEERTGAILSLGMIGTQRATNALLEALNDAKPDIRARVIEVLGSAAGGVNSQRRMASIAVLDRADKMTANKGEQISDDDLDAEIERRLARLAKSSQAENAGSSDPDSAG